MRMLVLMHVLCCLADCGLPAAAGLFSVPFPGLVLGFAAAELTELSVWRVTKKTP